MKRIIQSVLDLIERIKNVKLPKLPKLPKIPGMASGVRDWVGGLARVGEHGPEMAILPAGTSIATSAKTSQIMDRLVSNRYGGHGGGETGAGRGGTIVNASFNVTAPTIEEIIKRLHGKVDELAEQMRYRALRGGSALNGRLM